MTSVNFENLCFLLCQLNLSTFIMMIDICGLISTVLFVLSIYYFFSHNLFLFFSAVCFIKFYLPSFFFNSTKLRVTILFILLVINNILNVVCLFLQLVFWEVCTTQKCPCLEFINMVGTKRVSYPEPGTKAGAPYTMYHLFVWT